MPDGVGDERGRALPGPRGQEAVASYMAYRTAVPFPQVGAAINKAIAAIATGQATAEAAMKTANQEAATDIKKAGFKIEI